MRLLTLAILLFLPEFALASPWFDQAAAEKAVAQAMPDYYEHLATRVKDKDPEKYQNQLHQALVLTVNSQYYPEMLEIWNRKWDAEMRFREKVEEWNNADADSQSALRTEMLSIATEIQSADLELFQFKYTVAAERLDRLELQIADTETNMDMLALERVMSALEE